MRNWQEHWSSHPDRFAPTDYLRQVGKTVGGVPISSGQLDAIFSDIRHGLQPAPGDSVLDLCCGNGLLTRRIAELCNRVVGVDYSPALLDVAGRHQRARNLSYVHGSVLDLESLPALEGMRFNKILMYEALQHFAPADLYAVFEGLLGLVTRDCRVFIGSVPDRERIWSFYNTPRRRLNYMVRSCFGNEAIGTWWERGFLFRACSAFGLTASFREQSPGLHTSHYRFDMVASVGSPGRPDA